jgi:tripartite-type tricarboxylate transporter receptor subunit TctC
VRRLAAALAGAGCWMIAAPGAAQSVAPWPSKPIHVIVPATAGGPPDLMIRLLAPKLSAALGQPLVIENRAGGSGVPATQFVAKAPPDGYTWLFNASSHVNTAVFDKSLPYDPVKDFTAVTQVAQNYGQVMMVGLHVPAKNVAELIELAKKQPGKLSYGSAGTGTASHIPAELMKSMAGVDILGVQYKGAAQAITDLLGGHIDMFFVGTQVALPHVQAGKVRALAVTGARRWKGMPEVPTMQEAGLKGFDYINWFGLWLPAGAPPEIVARLYTEMTHALADPEVREQFDKQGLEPVGSKPEDFTRFVARDTAFTRDMARRIDAGAPK